MRLRDTNKMTNDQIITAAKKAGYIRKTGGNCPVCGANCHKFNKKGLPHYYYACVNGHRFTKDKWEPTDVTYCKECKRARVYKTEIEENGGYCWHCRPKKDNPQPPAEKNVGHAPEVKKCKCGNPLPADRKQRCYSCQPQGKRAKAAAKKEVAQQVVM
jgi:hypothetical protein